MIIADCVLLRKYFLLTSDFKPDTKEAGSLFRLPETKGVCRKRAAGGIRRSLPHSFTLLFP